MALTQRSTAGTKTWYGLSSDTKPSDVAGTLFWETDTSILYEYSGTSWFAHPTGGGGTGGAGDASAANQTVLNARVGDLTEAAPASDTASSGLNGRSQRIAQNLTTLTGRFPAALGAGGGIKIDGSGTALPVSGAFWQATQPVSGTFWQATQPISAASLPLPTGAATAAKQPALGTAGAASTDVLTVQGIASGVALPVTGTFWQTTQPVSAASLPLPTGAATAAKQPALGTAGAASTDVLTVQGIASGVPAPVKIDQTSVGTTDSVSVKKTPLTAAAPTTATAGIASTQAVAANSSRKGLSITNTHGTNTVSLAFSGNAAVLNNGVTIGPGIYWEMAEYTFTTGQVTCIASGANTNLAVQEWS